MSRIHMNIAAAAAVAASLFIGGGGAIAGGPTPPPEIVSIDVPSYSTLDNVSIARPQTLIPEFTVYGRNFFPSGTTGPVVTLRRAGQLDRSALGVYGGDNDDGWVTARNLNTKDLEPGVYDVVLQRHPSNPGSDTLAGAFIIYPHGPDHLVSRGAWGGPVTHVERDAEVIHDQRGTIASGTTDGLIDAYISGMSEWGEIRDQQACDDFELAASKRVTRITVDFASIDVNGESPILTPAGGFLIELFPDINGTPAEAPAYAAVSHAATNVGQFPPPAPAPWVTAPETGTFVIDLPDSGAVLTAGVWWVSVVAVDESSFGQWYKWMGLQEPKTMTGASAHRRAGGVDHGNGYPGVQTNTDWRSNLNVPPQALIAAPRQLSFAIEGFEVPSADIDGDGVVGSADLAAMLGQWGDCAGGAGTCPADLDGDGAVGSVDLASLLGAWGSMG